MAKYLMTVTLTVPYEGDDPDGAEAELVHIVRDVMETAVVDGVDELEADVEGEHEDFEDDAPRGGTPMVDPPAHVLLACGCGQLNRLPVDPALNRLGVGGWFVTPKATRCGACKSALPQDEQYVS